MSIDPAEKPDALHRTTRPSSTRPEVGTGWRVDGTSFAAAGKPSTLAGSHAGIAPFEWVVNQALTPLQVRDPVLAARRTAEAKFLDEVRVLSSRIGVVGWAAEPPTGASALVSLVHATSSRTAFQSIQFAGGAA